MLRWLMASDVALYIGANAWAQQALETVHMLAFSAMIGAIAVADLRLLGRGRSLPPDAWWPLVNWIAWAAMLALTVSGVLMFLPRAEPIALRTAFQIKMGLLVLALANLVYVQQRTRQLALVGGGGVQVPIALQAMAAASLLLWAATIITARFMYAIDQVLGTTRQGL